MNDTDLMTLLDKIQGMINQPNCEQIEERCDETAFHVFLMGQGFLCVFCLALFGNCINLLIYNSDQIRYYLAIRMLCSRLTMNCFTMLFLLPQALRTVGVWEPNSEYDHMYWKYYPYQAYFVNVFGFSSMWLTVLMTGECYLHVFYPGQSKSLCTRKNLSKSYVVIIGIGLLLALIYPLNRTATVSTDECDRVVVNIIASTDAMMQLAERVHTVTQLLLSIIVPMSLLIYMTLSVVWRLILKKSEFPSASHFTSEKRCVTRITLITTFLQLLSELPPIPVFIYAVISGPQVANDKGICIWNTIGVFLGLCNMSLSFFVYLALSQKFREMVYRRLLDLCSQYLPCCSSVSDKRLEYGLSSDRMASRGLLAKSPLVTDSSFPPEKSTVSTVETSNDDAFL